MDAIEIITKSDEFTNVIYFTQWSKEKKYIVNLAG